MFESQLQYKLPMGFLHCMTWIVFDMQKVPVQKDMQCAVKTGEMNNNKLYITIIFCFPFSNILASKKDLLSLSYLQ
jgi:hypothetical protein